MRHPTHAPASPTRRGRRILAGSAAAASVPATLPATLGLARTKTAARDAKAITKDAPRSAVVAATRRTLSSRHSPPLDRGQTRPAGLHAQRSLARTKGSSARSAPLRALVHVTQPPNAGSSSISPEHADPLVPPPSRPAAGTTLTNQRLSPTPPATAPARHETVAQPPAARSVRVALVRAAGVLAALEQRSVLHDVSFGQPGAAGHRSAASHQALLGRRSQHAGTAPSGAHAASPIPTYLRSKFACLRRLESGSNYAEDTGNGYFGAYQFGPTTWSGVGGPPELPSAAPPQLQDRLAYRLYKMRGGAPWPHTAWRCGLG